MNQSETPSRNDGSRLYLMFALPIKAKFSGKGGQCSCATARTSWAGAPPGNEQVVSADGRQL